MKRNPSHPHKFGYCCSTHLDLVRYKKRRSLRVVVEMVLGPNLVSATGLDWDWDWDWDCDWDWDWGWGWDWDWD